MSRARPAATSGRTRATCVTSTKASRGPRTSYPLGTSSRSRRGCRTSRRRPSGCCRAMRWCARWSDMAKEQKIDETERYVRVHLAFGWWALAAFTLIGLVLDTLHGLKIGWYLDVTSGTRRLSLTLGHAHGTLLALVNIAFAL